MHRSILSSATLALALALGVIACDGSGGSEGTESDGVSTVEPSPATDLDAIGPPLEGPERPRLGERVNYRELPEFALPDPSELPAVPDDEDGQEFRPPASGACPNEWEVLDRVGEGFRVCYPPDWRIGGHGYVTRGVDDRWYSVGIFRFDETGRERVHVSIYITNPFSQPFLYVANCDQAYRVALDGLPATLCPDSPGEHPEAKIIAYHVRRDDRDYFVNVVPLLEYEADTGRYGESWSEEDEEIGVQIAQTIQFPEPLPEY